VRRSDAKICWRKKQAISLIPGLVAMSFISIMYFAFYNNFADYLRLFYLLIRNHNLRSLRGLVNFVMSGMQIEAIHRRQS